MHAREASLYQQILDKVGKEHKVFPLKKHANEYLIHFNCARALDYRFPGAESLHQDIAMVPRSLNDCFVVALANIYLKNGIEIKKDFYDDPLFSLLITSYKYFFNAGKHSLEEEDKKVLMAKLDRDWFLAEEVGGRVCSSGFAVSLVLGIVNDFIRLGLKEAPLPGQAKDLAGTVLTSATGLLLEIPKVKDKVTKMKKVLDETGISQALGLVRLAAGSAVDFFPGAINPLFESLGIFKDIVKGAVTTSPVSLVTAIVIKVMNRAFDNLYSIFEKDIIEKTKKLIQFQKEKNGFVIMQGGQVRNISELSLPEQELICHEFGRVIRHEMQALPGLLTEFFNTKKALESFDINQFPQDQAFIRNALFAPRVPQDTDPILAFVHFSKIVQAFLEKHIAFLCCADRIAHTLEHCQMYQAVIQGVSTDFAKKILPHPMLKKLQTVFVDMKDIILDKESAATESDRDLVEQLIFLCTLWIFCKLLSLSSRRRPGSRDARDGVKNSFIQISEMSKNELSDPNFQDPLWELVCSEAGEHLFSKDYMQLMLYLRNLNKACLKT